ncbi:hypothetical protein BU17DRAFT_74799 [Hysterangium stoloniferum]|nr:hypothetical protein BU17DRAFT_74799 [Hysterangium stoloniferum]
MDGRISEDSGPSSNTQFGTSPAPALAAANEALAQMRLSFDSSPGGGSPGPSTVNGFSFTTGEKSINGEGDLAQSMQEDLQRTKQENETLTTKYNTLVAKLTAMRTSVESKLKRDAEELDQREQLVQQLTVRNDDLASTIERLTDEVIQSNQEAERSSRELETLRARIFQDSAQEVAAREHELMELQSELERCRIERDEWEQALQSERVVSDGMRADLVGVRRELDLEQAARAKDASELAKERERSANLQSVLEDFQSAREHETRQAVHEYKEQLRQATQSLAEYKSRALRAEVELEESSTNTHRSAALEKEVKEKQLLIGKLRHEAVILNEHLTEAIRRLRRDASDNNVDRRLVTNVILSFLTTLRTDSKRFEILALLASILSWSDEEREKAGLQRSGSGSGLLWGSGKGKAPELEKTDETESFSKMWVEFLLKEAAQGASSSGGVATPTSTRNGSLPASPVLSPQSVKMGRISSFNGTNTPGMEYSERSPPPRRGSLQHQ